MTLFFAALLTFGVLAPMTASAQMPTLLRANDKTVVEGDYGYTPAYVRISLNHRVHHAVSVGWYTRSGTARAWRDFRPTAGRAYIPTWHKNAYARVLVKGDRLYEPNEFFFVKLVNPYGARLGYHPVARVTILNDDHAMPPPPPPPPPEKSKLLVRDLEVGEAAGVANVQVLLMGAGRHPEIRFDFATVDAKAKGGASCQLPNVDYVSKSGRAEIESWQNSTTIPVTICNDTAFEGNEDFLLRVSGVDTRLVDVLKSFSHVVILDNDQPASLPVLSINDTTAAEGTKATLTVTLSAPPAPGKDVTVTVATYGGGSQGGAQPNVDFKPMTQTLTFTAASPGPQTVQVDVLSDTVSPEPQEQFIVRLDNELNATVAAGHRAGVVTIPSN